MLEGRPQPRSAPWVRAGRTGRRSAGETGPSRGWVHSHHETGCSPARLEHPRIRGGTEMNAGKLGRVGLMATAALLVGSLVAVPAAHARKKVVTKTYEVGVGAPGGGFAIPINDGAGQAAQLARSPIDVR